MVVGLPPNRECLKKHHHRIFSNDLIDVLNRLAPITLTREQEVPSKENIQGRDARHVLKHIFPRQFGLSNPFTAQSEKAFGPLLLPDFTDRDQEIKVKGNVKTPPRLKPALELIERLIKRHWACNYRGLRGLVCSSKVNILHNQHKPDESHRSEAQES
ncbi:hypothetical protein M422DRAFT_186138 [Sphaerobolus stellatus SS14]|uniref:Uncharacterized protein n=1 Tax=Sphaerobolus stellatus (strain SS14) TaxID=990650 RepID=A0A0C9TMY6_SPHS4|nr:hypothetical protein M422DRAFT_186138 [Sphaerobolus stellatus SS14]